MLSIDHCTNGCGTMPAGTVSYMDVSGGLEIDVSLLNGNLFKSTTGNGLNAFTFDLSSTAGVSLSSITSGFSLLGPGTYHQDGFGDFNYAVSCDAAASGNCGTSLSLLLSGASIALLESSVGGSPSVWFSADIRALNGNTGPIGGLPSPVPIPPAIALFGTGLAGLAAMALRRRKNTGLLFPS